MATLEDIFNNIEKNPYCPNCNKRLSWSQYLHRGIHLNSQHIETYYICYDCSFDNQVAFYRIYNNGKFVYNFQFMFENMNLMILNQDMILEVLILYKDRSSLTDYITYIDYKDTQFYIDSIKYPYLNKETIKYLENLIFR